jgi:diguanylate cyclase (GGDEF)-like protein
MDAPARKDASPAPACPTCGGGLVDPLTGVFSGELFAVALGRELDRHHRYGTTAALVVVELDDEDGDGFDPARRDAALRAVAAIIAPLVRTTDLVSRLSCTELGILLPETRQLDALLAAERLRGAVSRASADLLGRRVTVSAGVAGVPEDGLTATTLHRRVRAALDLARGTGGNMCAVAREDAGTPESPLLAHLHAVVDGIDGQHLATRDHSENVAAYAAAIAARLGFHEERLVRLRRAAFLHDVGKVAVPHEVLEKPGALTDGEFAQVRLHPEVGGHMLAHAHLHEEAAWVRHHHERLDGRGYPDGLAGEAIPFESRVIFVADAFEAMTSDRPYRRGMASADALGELRACAGVQFEPAAVEVLCDLVESGALAPAPVRRAS